MTTDPFRPSTASARAIFGPREAGLDKILRTSLLDKRMPTIQVDDNAARVLQLLTLVHQPQRVVEIGSLFGYSTIHIARGLPQGGKVISYEIDPIAANLAQKNLSQLGLSDRVEVCVGDALEHLYRLEPATVDMVFIDAAKAAYPDYLKAVYPLLKTGGLLIADDILADGVYNKEAKRDGANAELDGLSRYARAVVNSPKLFSALMGTQTGLLVSVKT